MTSPFATYTIKVYPHTSKIGVGGQVFSTPESLWNHLQSDANLKDFGKSGTLKLGDVILTPQQIHPEVAAALAAGKVKRYTKSGKLKLTQADLDAISANVAEALKNLFKDSP